MSLSEYEQRVLREITERKAQQVARSPRRIVPEPVKERAGDLAHLVGGVRGVGTLRDKVGTAYLQTAAGASRAVSRLSSSSLSEDRILRAYRRRGVEVSSLEDVRALDLHQVERRVKPKRMDLVYASLAAAEGAAAGAVITGGEVLATGGSVAGLGAGGAPGIGTVAGAMAVDAAVVLAAAQRVVSHTGLYYGYDPNDPAEAAFALSVVNLGSAVTAGGKMAAYRELSTLTQMLARRATWRQLNEHVLPRIAQQFAVRFGGRLTQRKLGQLVPVIGIGVGAVMNFRLIDNVAEAAYWTYRERFLLDKGADEDREWSRVLPLEPTDGGGEGEADVEINLVEIIEDAMRDTGAIAAGSADGRDHQDEWGHRGRPDCPHDIAPAAERHLRPGSGVLRA